MLHRLIPRWLSACLMTLMLWLLYSVWAWPQTPLQPIPPLTARVMDTTITLDARQRQALEDKLAAFEAARGSQIVILLVPTTQPEDIVSYTQRVGDAWKIGRKDIGDGVLVVVATRDRQVRIATAKTLEGAIPDLAARQVIEQAITPRFRAGDFAGGLNAGVDQLMALISGEKLPAPDAAAQRPPAAGFQWLDMALLMFLAVPFMARIFGALLGRKSGSLLAASLVGLLAWWLTASMVVTVLAALAGLLVALISGAAGSQGGPPGRGGPFGGPGGFSAGRGTGGFGGFRSGGGGNFGGGGASGRW